LAKTTARNTEVVRRWTHLDSIARSRQGDHIRVLKNEIEAAERSFAGSSVGLSGQPMAPIQRDAILDAIAQKREALRATESLSGDELVFAYCANELATTGQ